MQSGWQGWRGWVLGIGLICGMALAQVSAQSLPTQVLQLLARDNTWTGEQSFQDLRVPCAAVPGDTTDRIYCDSTDDVLYFNGQAITASGGGVAPHNLLSTTHPDTLVGSPVRGSILVANSTPKWAAFTIGAVGTVLRSDGTDPSWSTNGSALTALNATQLTSGTIPLARIVALTNTEIDAAAAIAWTKISKTGSSLADLTTRSAADLSSGTLANARLSSTVSLFGTAVDTSEISNGAVTATKLADFSCTSGQGMSWNGLTWGCSTFGTGSGTVTSVALSLPAIFTVSGSPVTTTGTLTGALATQVANRVWAGPTIGADASPTFRALVNADLPLTGVGGGTYTRLTVNTAGVVTAAAAQIVATTDVSGVLPLANGGTSVSSAADDTTLVSSGAAWVATAIPNAVTNSVLQYATATNTFSALANVATQDNTLTLTNKTLNVESTGNVFTTVEKWYWRAAYCQNVTALTEWSTPTSNPAVAACVTGSNTQKGVLDFADGANTLSVQTERRLPSDWTGTVDVALTWYTAATSGDVVWQVATICVASGETGDPAYTTASTVTQTAQGTTNQYNVAAITTLTVTGCAAGEQLYLRVFRDPTNGSDTLAATARLVGVELTARRVL